MKKTKKIGIEVVFPKQKCDDKKCPFHSSLSIKGRIFTGTIKSKDTNKTAVVTWSRLVKVKKYERFEKRRTKLKAHNPLCINAKIGDKVKIAECRKLSKTKNFVILQVLK